MHIDHLLAASRATDDFKHDVRAYALSGYAPRIVLLHRAPRIKVLRVIAQLLSTTPALAVERIRVNGRAGCADFVGTLEVDAEGRTRHIAFAWDCAWRAQLAGWSDAFGFPDQIRAAQEFEWRCFREWRELPSAEPAALLVANR